MEPTERRQGTHVIWKCRCKCGNICYVLSASLLSGNTKSCGCLQKEKLEERHRAKGCRIASDYTEEENEEYHKTRSSFYNQPKWRNLRKEILDEQKSCYVCNSTLDPHVHHIQNRKEYPDKAYDKDNLIVMCNSCHTQYHNFVCNHEFEQSLYTLQLFKDQKIKQVV